MSYAMSDAAAEAIAMSSTILSGVSLAFCLFLLSASLWIYSVPSARHTIDRISFRMMLWSMVFGVGYDICYILLEPKTGAIDPSTDQCQVVMYWQLVTMGAVNYFITCIAVNLMLSICFAYNSVHLRLERWYIAVSLFTAFFVPIVPTILGHFGADPVYASCYFTDTNLKDRLRNFVLDLYLWQATSTLISCAAVIATLVTLSRSGRATAKALLYKGTYQSDPSGNTQTESSSTCNVKRLFRRKPQTELFQLQDRFMNIAIRIALYPVVMVIMNTVLTVGDLYLSANGDVTTRAEYGLYVVYYVFYGSRNLLLALIGIFVDPGLPQGLRLALKASRRRRQSVECSSSAVDLEQDDLDFVSALASVPFNPQPSIDKPQERIWRWKRSDTRRKDQKAEHPAGCFAAQDDIPNYTRSFNGVTASSLPHGMTDEVDVDTRREIPMQLMDGDGTSPKRYGEMFEAEKEPRPRRRSWFPEREATSETNEGRLQQDEEERFEDFVHRL